MRGNFPLAGPKQDGAMINAEMSGGFTPRKPLTFHVLSIFLSPYKDVAYLQQSLVFESKAFM